MEETHGEFSRLMNRNSWYGYIIIFLLAPLTMVALGALYLELAETFGALLMMVVSVLFILVIAHYYLVFRRNLKQFETAVKQQASQSRFGDAIVSQLGGLGSWNTDDDKRLEHSWQALIATELEDDIDVLLPILQEYAKDVDDQKPKNVVSELQQRYADIPTDADPEAIVGELQEIYQFTARLYAATLGEAVSAIRENDWKRLENRLETVANIEATSIYEGEPERWEPSTDLVETQETISNRRNRLGNGIAQLDDDAPEDRERRFRYGARLARLERIRDRLEAIEAHTEEGEILRAQDELRECRDSLDELAEIVEDDGFDSLETKISTTDDRRLEIERAVQNAMTVTDKPTAASTTDTVDWTPETGAEEPGELPDHEVIEEIGSGGNADVRKVELTDTGEVAALKIPRWQGTMSAEVISEFTDEAETWESIDDHDHIVSVHDTGTTPYPWMLLEYMESGSLRDRLNEGGAVERPDEVLVDICEAVSHAHRYGIAHNDLKPANILFDSEDMAKVADWGLAKVLLDHSTSVEGLTPQYAAPEQLNPDEHGGTDDATDIYQPGVIAYELLTGNPPYDCPNPAGTVNAILEADPVPPSEQNPDLPPAVDNVVLQAMAPEKADRYEHILYPRDELSALPI